MNDRGTGITSQQMRDAPTGAIYVWCNRHTDYARSLARHLSRGDLKIVTPEAADRAIRGTRFPVVIDHAAILPLSTLEVIFAANQRLAA